MAPKKPRNLAFAVALLLMVACAVQASPACGQTIPSAPQSAPAMPFAYEVVSIKPYKSGNGDWINTRDGFSADGVTVQTLMFSAYEVLPDRVANLPAWALSEPFDVQAKMDEETMTALNKLPPRQQSHQEDLMLQAILADRFQLKVHHEIRELPVYELVVAKGGLRMKESSASQRANWSERGDQIAGKGISFNSLVFNLASITGRVVINKSGLTGYYDFTLKWTPDGQQETADSGPSIFAAVEEQLGLKLVPAKGPVDTIVVDHIEKPSPN